MTTMHTSNQDHTTDPMTAEVAPWQSEGASPFKELRLPPVGEHYSDPEYPDVDVAIVMESTYPYLKGGVSAVVHDIITANPDITYGIIHIAWDTDSPLEDLYGMPENVAWVKPVFLSMEEHRDGFANADKDLKMNRRERIATSHKLMDALFALYEDADVNPLWEMYDEGFNPKTRRYPLWSLLGTKEFMKVMFDRLPLQRMSFSDNFWLMRTFFSLAYALLHERMPHAKVYHAHTTGYASLIGAAAARDHGTSFFLTEHNLYVRDTVNTLLDRDMSKPIKMGDWNTLPNNEEQRAWTMWWIQLGRFCYPSADKITYLYPKALDEARGLDAPVDVPDRAIVLPNGMQISDVNEAYAQRRIAREKIELQGTNHHWRIVFIARVVPIKGLIDLIDSVEMLRDEGYQNLHIDVLGPTQHVPAYYDLCRTAIAEKELEDYFTFHGTVNVREMLGQFDLLIMPSYNEGQPIVALEAMSASLPVVGTDVGGMSQLIEDTLTTTDGVDVEGCGILTQPGDARGYADVLKKIMDYPETYEQWCINARDRVVGCFQLADMMERYNVLYRQLGNLGPKPEKYHNGAETAESLAIRPRTERAEQPQTSHQIPDRDVLAPVPLIEKAKSSRRAKQESPFKPASTPNEDHRPPQLDDVIDFREKIRN